MGLKDKSPDYNASLSKRGNRYTKSPRMRKEDLKNSLNSYHNSRKAIQVHNSTDARKDIKVFS